MPPVLLNPSRFASGGGGGSYSTEVLADAPVLWHRLDQLVTVSAATASSNYPADPPSNAFDGSSSSPWTTNGTSSGWLRAQLDAAAVLTQYAITSRSGFTSRSPKDWTFEGSNDGTSWTVLDTRTGVTSWTGGDTKTYTFSNSTAYLYYRLNVSANNGDTYLNVTELVLARFLDASGNNRPIDIITGTAPTVTAGGPKLTTSAEWGASAGHMRTSYSVAQPTVGTYECWINASAYPAADLCLQTWVPDGGSSGGTSAVYLLSTGKIRLFLYTGATVNLDSASAISTGGWHHIVCSWGAAGSKIRIDKASAASGATTSCQSNAVAFYRSHGYYNGGSDVARTGAVKTAEEAFYASQLSDARTDAHYDAA